MDTTSMSGLDTAITAGYYLSSLGFLVASIITIMAIKKFGKSTLGSIFSYLFIGTGIFFIITIFQKLGGSFFHISDQSMDVWWHLMFYMAFIFYYYGLKYLVGLGNADPATTQQVKVGAENKWGLVAIIILAIFFIIPKMVEPFVMQYDTSILYSMGVHHFIAFILAGIVGYYLVSAKKRIGQIGRAIATPMIVAIWALGLQHLWELLNESWKVVHVTSSTGEGVEKIFLIIAAVGIIYAAARLKSFATA